MVVWIAAAVGLIVVSLVLWAMWRRLQDQSDADPDDYSAARADAVRDDRSRANVDEARVRLGGRRF